MSERSDNLLAAMLEITATLQRAAKQYELDTTEVTAAAVHSLGAVVMERRHVSRADAADAIASAVERYRTSPR